MQSFLPSALREKPHPQKEDKDEQSLTSILSREERTEFTLLLNDVLASQRRRITDIFDPRYAGSASDKDYDQFAVKEQTKVSLDDVKKDLEKAAAAKGQDEEFDVDEELKAAERRIKELQSPETQELKKNALDHFDAWRDTVLARVGEVVNSRQEATAQKESAHAVTPEVKEQKIEDVPADTTASETESQKPVEPSEIKEEEPSQLDKVSRQLYPPISNPLSALPVDKRKLIIHSTLLLLLSLEHYSSYSRVLIIHLTTSLNLQISFLTITETAVAKTLIHAAAGMSAEESRKKREEEGAESKKWKIGLATVAGAAIIGLTGGLAAPLLAAGVGTVMGGLGLEATVAAAYLGTLASSSVVVGGLFGAYGGRMTGKMMGEYAKEVEDFGFVPVRKTKGHGLSSVLHGTQAHTETKDGKEKSKEEAAKDADDQRLRLAIGISGWLTAKDEVVSPWRVLSPTITTYALRFELQALLALGNAITAFISSAAWSFAKKEAIKRTMLIGLTEALWPLAILKVGRIVDNPYSIAKLRAEKAGIVLADALIKKVQGERPVTLVGYSMGARVIYHCLLSLASRGAFGLVENAVLLGGPVPADSKAWRQLRAVVAGRLVNVYSANDYVLAFLHRTSSVQFGVAGLQAPDFVRGIESVDASDIVDGHLRYRFLTGSILKRIGFEDLDLEEVEREEAELRAIEEVEKEERQRKEDKDPDVEANELEKEVEKKNEEGMLDWATGRLNLGYESAKSFITGRPASSREAGVTGGKHAVA